MRRANKILMAAVAILLCLVLITTSVVSGVFAKYAIKKQASTSVGLEKFGVELGITVQPELITTVGTNNVVTVNDGENVSVTITNLKMSPGMKFYDAIKIHADGHTTVATQFKMTFSISFTKDDFKVDSTTSRMPLGFRLTAFNSSGGRIEKHDKVAVANPFLKNYAPKRVSYAIANNTADYIDFSHTEKDDYSTNYVTKDFAADTDVVFKTKKLTTNVYINDFSVGFYYPLDATGETSSNLTAVDIDKWSTALASNGKNLTATINYTISLTQTS